MRSSRCLLILDNAESILQAGAVAGQYRPDYEGYGEFIKRVGETSHRSCLILTSCEKPQELAALAGETLPVRSLELTGLHEEEARAIFQAKGDFTGTPDEWKEVIHHYAGNPLALNMIASGIRDVFDSNISEFVKQLKVSSSPFSDISNLLERQFNRMTDSEKEVVYWLAINCKPISFTDLKEDIICPALKQQLPDTLKSLRRKSLIEKTNALFTLQPAFIECVANRLISKFCEEIETGKIALFNSHSLLKMQAEDFGSKAQIRLILKPVRDRLVNHLRGKSNVKNHLKKFLLKWQIKYPLAPSYTASNVRNLLNQLNNDSS